MSSTATPVTAAAKPKVTILQHIGNILRGVLHIGVEVAAEAEPVVDLAFPAIAGLYNSAVGLAQTAEASIGAAQGTGAQKLAQLTATLVPQAEAWAKANGITWPVEEINAWASSVVDTINLIPAPTGVAATAGTATLPVTTAAPAAAASATVDG